MSSIVDAARLAARHYPGGLPAIAVRMGKPLSTLEKELRCAPGYKLGADDAAELSALCIELGAPHHMAYANAVVEPAGGVVMLLPRHAVADEATAHHVADLMRECADVVSSTAQAQADGELTDNELRDIEAQWHELMAAGQSLMAHLRACNARSKARAPQFPHLAPAPAHGRGAREQGGA